LCSKFWPLPSSSRFAIFRVHRCADFSTRNTPRPSPRITRAAHAANGPGTRLSWVSCRTVATFPQSRLGEGSAGNLLRVVLSRRPDPGNAPAHVPPHEAYAPRRARVSKTRVTVKLGTSRAFCAIPFWPGKRCAARARSPKEHQPVWLVSFSGSSRTSALTVFPGLTAAPMGRTTRFASSAAPLLDTTGAPCVAPGPSFFRKTQMFLKTGSRRRVADNPRGPGSQTGRRRSQSHALSASPSPLLRGASAGRWSALSHPSVSRHAARVG
jgi:hypothetical protein